jgi:LmbE family N-acetylglucosaminyl deacetylase
MSYPRTKHWIAAVTAPLHLQSKKKANKLPILEVPTAKDRIVIFSPHPDDETCFAGGLIASARSARATVHIVLVSDGNARRRHEERIAEFQKATRLLGVPPQNLRYYLIPDGKLDINRDKVGLLMSKTLTELDPTLVIAPHPADSHRDHRILAEVTASHTSVTLLHYLSHFPPSFPWPRKHVPHASLMPPKALLEESWHSLPLSPTIRRAKLQAMHAYERELKTPTLRSLLLAFDRTNELFSVRESS